MNEETPNPEAPGSEKSEIREITKQELAQILEFHRKWVESEGKEGKPADLSYTNLQKADLIGANLQRADLGGANLQGAHLFRANLQGAAVRGVNLQEADLFQANLQQTDLSGANLGRAKLFRTELREARLQDASLTGAKSLLAGQLAGLLDDCLVHLVSPYLVVKQRNGAPVRDAPF